MQSFKMIFSGVTILQGVEFPIFLLIFAWALQQCSATAVPVMELFSPSVAAETPGANIGSKSAISRHQGPVDLKKYRNPIPSSNIDTDP